MFESLPGVGKLGRLLFLFYRGKQGLSLANQFGRCLPSQRVADLSWAFVSLNSLPLLRIANKENSATPSAEDRCMVEGRALTTPALQDAPSSIWSPCRAALGEFRGALKVSSRYPTTAETVNTTAKSVMLKICLPSLRPKNRWPSTHFAHPTSKSIK